MPRKTRKRRTTPNQWLAKRIGSHNGEAYGKLTIKALKALEQRQEERKRLKENEFLDSAK